MHALCYALREELGDVIEFYQPEGGMFVWGRIDGVDASDLLTHVIPNKVIFVHGNAFYFDKLDAAALRLSFAAPRVSDIHEGVARLKRAYSAAIKAAAGSLHSS